MSPDAFTAFAAPIPAERVGRIDLQNRKEREPDILFAPIEYCYERLNSVFGCAWNLETKRSELRQLVAGEIADRFLATSEVRISVDLRKLDRAALPEHLRAMVADAASTGEWIVYRDGVGADSQGTTGRESGFDRVDMCIKTAHANAVKKATNAFGLGLELWQAEERARVRRELAEAGHREQLIDGIEKADRGGLVAFATKAARKELGPEADGRSALDLVSEWLVSHGTEVTDTEQVREESFLREALLRIVREQR